MKRERAYARLLAGNQGRELCPDAINSLSKLARRLALDTNPVTEEKDRSTAMESDPSQVRFQNGEQQSRYLD